MSRDALVVGINSYQCLPSLQAPAKDAEAIAQKLQTYGEFRIHRLPEVIQAGKPQIGQKTQVALRDLEIALINLFKPKGRNIPHTALFYFSGHGIQREAGIREGYLALSDSNPDQGFYGLSLFWLRRLLQESPVRQRIIWLDCCHSGELLNFLEADPGADPGTDRLFMAASREYETAYESLESPYSIFTQALLTGLDPRRVEAGIVTNHSLTDWVNHSLKGEIQQPLFESSGSEIVLTRCAGAQPNPPARTGQAATDICPYRGLECFDEAHADYFFGREDLTAQLIEKLKTERFIAITGASGIGKSSLVRAGLIAQLRRQSAQGEIFQENALNEAESGWRIKLLTPTAHPFKSLATAFIDPELSELERAEQLRRAEIFLQDGGIGLAQLVRASLPMHSGTPRQMPQAPVKMLLVIDQFEEIFTLVHGSQPEQERQKFLNCLLGAMHIAKDSLCIVIVLRADFLSKCSLYKGLAQQIKQHQIIVPPLKYEQIKATIIRPAQKVGLVCDPSLIYTMLLDIIGAPGELPLLQYTLLELWQHRRTHPESKIARLTLDAYQELGGVRGTLQKRSTDVFYSLTTEEQKVAKRIFLALTQLGEGTEDTRRRIVKSELISPAYPIDRVERVLEKLVAAKLVITNQDSIGVAAGGTELEDSEAAEQPKSQIPNFNFQGFSSGFYQEIVDVTHEALIRNWSLLRTWLEENREMLRRQRRIEQAAQEWGSAGQPTAGGYLLHGLRLRDAEDFIRTHAQELSALAQQYVDASCQECRRARRESRQLRIAVPSILLASLAILFSQYHGVVKNQAAKERQLQRAMSRERAAIAQTILQDSNNDPMTALLVGRLAVAEEPTYEAQSSLRASLQNLRLQLELRGHEGAVHQLAFSPDRHYLATASADGTIRLWATNAQTLYNTHLESSKILNWDESPRSSQANASPQSAEAEKPADIIALVFSPDGRQLAAIARNSPQVKIWTVASGSIVSELTGSAATTQIAFSPDGKWLATADVDQTIALWQVETGRSQVRLPQPALVNSLQFSPNSQFLLAAEQNGTAQLWHLAVDANQTLKPTQTTTLSQPSPLNQVTFSSSGRWIAAACEDGNARVWNTVTGQLRQTFSQNLPEISNVPETRAEQQISRLPISNALTQVQFSPNEQMLAATDQRDRTWLWNAQSGQLQSKLTATNDVLNNPLSDDSLSNNLNDFQPRQKARTNLLSFSPDNHLIVTATAQPVPPNGFSTARLWDTQTGREVGILPGHKGGIEAAQFSPDGTYLATASSEGVVRLWAAIAGGELPTLQLPNAPVQWAMFLQNDKSRREGEQKNLGQTGAAYGKAIDTSPQNFGWFKLFFPLLSQGNPNSRQPDLFHPYPESGASQAANTARSDWESDWGKVSAVAPATTDSLIVITPAGKFQDWQILTDSAPNPPRPSAIPALPSGRTSTVAAELPAAIQSQIDPQPIWQRLRIFLSQRWQNLSSAHADTAQEYATSGLDRLPQFVSALVTPAGTAAEVALPGNLSGVGTDSFLSGVMSGVALSPNGQTIATASSTGDIEIRQIQPNSIQPDQPSQLVHRIQNWRAVLGKDMVLSQVLSQAAPAITPAIIPTTTAQAENSSVQQGLAQTIAPQEKAQPGTSGEPVSIRQLTFSPDGQQLLGVGDDFTVRLWDVRSGQLLQVLRGHRDTVQQARFSPDGQWIVTASWDKTARIWQVASGQSVKVLNHENAVSSASFSPDGQQVVTTSWDGKARIWEAETGEQKLLLTGHRDVVLDAQFSPDGRSLVTASADGAAILWDTQTGVQQAQLRPNRQELEPILQAFFSPDGQYVATLSKSGRVYLWAATWEMLLKLARDRSLRQLTPEECDRYLKVSPDACPILPLRS